MAFLEEVLNYILSFESFVLLPIIMFGLSMLIGVKISQALRASLTIGIGFVGISMVFTYFIQNMSPAIEALVKNLGIKANILDVGWSPFAITVWGDQLAGISILLILMVNIIMLVMKMTKTINIDIFNYWHFMLVGTMVFYETKNPILAITSSLVTSIVVLKLADWLAPFFEAYSGLKGITTTTLSTITYLPFGVIGNWMIDQVPGLNKWEVDAHKIKDKFGLWGEPMTLGLVLGLLIGLGARYDIKGIVELGVKFSAVIFLLPKMAGVLGEGLLPISESMGQFMKKRFPKIKDTYIGVDVAVLLGDPSVIVTGLILIPIILFLSLVLPGVSYIPVGDLAVIMVLTVMVVIISKGNIVRSVIIGIPILVIHLYIGTFIAKVLTGVAHFGGFDFSGYEGLVTSTTDGGNLLRYFLLKVFEGDLIAIGSIPVFVGLMFVTYKGLKRLKRKDEFASSTNEIK